MSKRFFFSFVLMGSLVLSCLGFSITMAQTTEECYKTANKNFLDCLGKLGTDISGGSAEQTCSDTLKKALDACSYSPNEVGMIINPLATEGMTIEDYVPTLISNIIRAILALVGSIALILFVVAGFQWMTARGNPEQVKKSTQTMLWAALGLLAIFSSFLILQFVLQTLGVPKT